MKNKRIWIVFCLIGIFGMLILSGCGSAISKNVDASSPKINKISNTTKSERPKQSTKQEQKEAIIDWENQLFSSLDNYSITWHKLINDTDLWADIQTSSFSHDSYKNAETKLNHIIDELSSMNKEMNTLQIPSGLPTDVMIDLSNAKGTLDDTMREQSGVFVDLKGMIHDKGKYTRQFDLKWISNELDKMTLEQRDFERQLNKVNDLYGIPEKHYFEQN